MSIIQGGHAPEFLTVRDDDSNAEEEVGDTAEIADVEAATLGDENFEDEVPALIDDDSDDGDEADVARPQSSAEPLEQAENAQGSAQPQSSEEPKSKQGQEPKSKQGQGPQLRRADLKAAGRQLDQGYDPRRADRSRRSDSQAQLFGSLAATAEVQEERLRAASVKVPRSHGQAMRSDHSKQWNEAEQDHIESHMVRGTWVEVIVPEGTRTLPTHWVYQVKQDSDGYVDRFKARTVLGGNKQIPGVDCQETFSPTMRGEQMRLLFAVAAELQADAQRLAGADISVLHVADVKNAYLQSLLEEDEQPLHDLPKGYQPKLTAQQGFKVVGRSVYAHPGLKQAGRAWYRTQREQLLARGFEEYAGATCIFVKRLGEGEFIVVGIFVDDLVWLNVTSDPRAIDKIVEDLQPHYEVKLAPKLEKFLGANFVVTEQGIHMHLRLYLEELLTRHGMMGSSPVPTPEVAREETKHDETLLADKDVKTYQQITGGLMYAAATVRVDIAHAVGVLTRRMAKPRVCDMLAAKRVLRYLKGTMGLGLFFRFGRSARSPGLVAYADSDWASDQERRKSTTGYLVFYNGAPISWRSALQDTIAMSSCEAEYIALSECAREVVYLRGILWFLGMIEDRGATVIREDNQGAIDLVGNPVHHRRTKHMEVKWHYVRHVEEKGEIDVQKVHTDDNRADILTKATDRETFVRHVSRIMCAAPEPQGVSKGGVRTTVKAQAE